MAKNTDQVDEILRAMAQGAGVRIPPDAAGGTARPAAAKPTMPADAHDILRTMCKEGNVRQDLDAAFDVRPVQTPPEPTS